MQSLFLLAVRLYWGWQFAQTGWDKLNHLARITDFFRSLGIPFPAVNAHFVAGLEFAGGLLLIAGLASPALLRDWQEIPSEALERREVRSLLQQAIGQLSPIYREVLVLRDIEELSIEETAGALAISISSVKVRLHRARIMLQKELAPKLKLGSPKKRRWLSWN